MYFRYWEHCYLNDSMTIRKGVNMPLLRSSDLLAFGITINMSSLPGFCQDIWAWCTKLKTSEYTASLKIYGFQTPLGVKCL